MAKKSEGAEVRKAFDGPTVEHDELIGQIEAMARDEHARSSDASESGARLKPFIEKTGLNTQVFSWMKTIVKKLPKKDGQSKAMDVIRSIEVALPMIKAHVSGQGTAEMDLGGEPAPEPAKAKSTRKPKEAPKGNDADDDGAVDPERAEFNRAVDEVVTPIDFGGARH
jgi:hypothetical protein